MWSPCASAENRKKSQQSIVFPYTVRHLATSNETSCLDDAVSSKNRKNLENYDSYDWSSIRFHKECLNGPILLNLP